MSICRRSNPTNTLFSVWLTSALVVVNLTIGLIGESFCLAREPDEAQQRSVSSKPVVAVLPVEIDGFSLSDAARSRLTKYIGISLVVKGKFEVVPEAQLRQALSLFKVEYQNDNFDDGLKSQLGREVAAQKLLELRIWKIGDLCRIIATIFDLSGAISERAAEIADIECAEEELMNGMSWISDQLSADPSCQTGASASSPEWISLRGGTFFMGSNSGDQDELPVHAVSIQDFEISRTEVTVEQYKRCVDAGVCTLPSTDELCNWGISGRDKHPVNCVDWSQARSYAAFAGGRLPTEAEWEFAARSQGLVQKYAWGNQEATCDFAVMLADAGGCGKGTTSPVCSKARGKTIQGLCDMAGNVWEWVEDWYHISYDGAPTNGSAWNDSGSLKVYRGGSWFSPSLRVRASNRSNRTPTERNYTIGFRVARSIR